MELYVFDLAFNRLGIIDDFESIKIERFYTKMGQLTMTVEGSPGNIELLQKGRILAKTEDIQHGFIILTREFLDEQSSQLEIIAPSLNILLNRRLILGQQSFTGNIENVLKSFVAVNAVTPANPNRIIPGLTISTNRGININTTEADSNVPLDEFLYEVCNKHDISWDVLLDVYNKRFIFDVWQGADRSAEQMVNPHVIFSKDRENVLKQDYTESDSDFKNVAVVAGEGEGNERTYLTVNDSVSGFDRIEMFVDARDLQSTYRDDNEEEITISPSEYQELLSERGKSKLTEYPKLQTFESDIDLYSNEIYGVDYFMGDKVSVKNDDLGIILHTRITAAKESQSSAGTSLDIEFGSNIPTLIDKLKRSVKK